MSAVSENRLISIHTLREEGDRLPAIKIFRIIHFYPHPPRGGRQYNIHTERRHSMHFYPHPPRGGRRNLALAGVLPQPISIHTLREEGDLIFPQRADIRAGDFYPHPPRGGRHTNIKLTIQQLEFLSTPSARRATVVADGADHLALYFYPHPPRGGRRMTWKRVILSTLFLSTPSARRATESIFYF